MGAQKKPDALLSLPNSPLPRCSRENGTGTGPGGRAPLLGGPAPRVDVPAVASAGGLPWTVSCGPRLGRSQAHSSMPASQHAEGSPGPYLGRCPPLKDAPGLGGGAQPLPCPLRHSGPRSCLRNSQSAAQGQAICLLPHSLLVQACNRHVPSSLTPGAGVPRELPRQQGGRGALGCSGLGWGNAGGRWSTEEGLRAGMGWGEGPEEEGLKQR